MAYGFCDIPGCEELTYMGWRPLTEAIGRQICEDHWCRHKDCDDDFKRMLTALHKDGSHLRTF